MEGFEETKTRLVDSEVHSVKMEKIERLMVMNNNETKEAAAGF